MGKPGGAHSWRPPLRLRAASSTTAIALGAFGLVVLACPALAEDESTLIRNNYGAAGLIDMPSARMAPDGALSAGGSFFKNTQHYNFGFQALPWLETNFRYTGLQHFDPNYPVYYDRSFAMKARLVEEGNILPAIAIGVNDVVGTGIYSGEYLVASKRFGAVDATIGIGWGRLGEAQSFKNPFTLISKSFDTRQPYSGAAEAGGTTFGNLFHGPTVGVFGGLTWDTPIDGLVLIGEFSSDKYSYEAVKGNFSTRSQFNFGASYQVNDYLDAGISWLYGRSLAFNFALAVNPVEENYPQKVGPAPLPLPDPRSNAQRQAAIDRLRRSPSQIASAGLDSSKLVDAVWQAAPNLGDVAIQGSTLTLTIGATDLRTTCRAIARLPELYRAGFVDVAVRNGQSNTRCAVTPFTGAPVVAAFTPLSDPSRVSGSGLSPMTIDARATEPNASAAIASIRKEALRQRLIIEAISFSDGEALVYYSNTRYFHERDAIERLVRILMTYAPPQIERFRLIATAGGVSLRDFEVLRTPIERSISQTGSMELAGAMVSMPAPLDNSVLTEANWSPYPHFSWQLFPQFRQELFDPSNPFGVQFLAGLVGTVELMPGLSVTGEAEASIWDDFNTGRPSDSLLPHVRTDFLRYFTQGKNGIGDLEADYRFRLSPTVSAIARVGYLESMFAGAGGEILWRPDGWRWALGADLYWVQRRNFDRLFGLQKYSVTTGHVSLYYDSPWYNLEFALRAGQYLAGDRGLTLEVSRRFESGVQIGAYMTRTNVSAERFGEGSFDKGIIIRIPLGWSLPVDTQTEYNLNLRPVQRDGGQRLAADAILYEETRRTSEAEMENTTPFAIR